MELLTGIGITAVAILTVIFSRSITTFVHEMGHAIPSLLFTNGQVVVCLGSYSDISKSNKFTLGRLTVYFKLNLLSWIIGLCWHEKTNSKKQSALIILGGPLASLILGLVFIKLFNHDGLSDLYKSLINLIIASSIFDFLVNIIPIQRALYLYNGSIMYNDGRQLQMLLDERGLPPSFSEGVKFMKDKKFEEAKVIFEKIIEDGFVKDVVNSNLIDCYIALEEYDHAIDNMDQYSSLAKMKNQDNAKLGFIFYALGAYEKALNYYNNAIHYDYTNATYLNGRGLVKGELGDHQGAILDFNASLNYNEGYVDPYVNLGRLYYNLDEKKESYKLLEAALKVDPKNADAHFHLGRYYDDINETQKAYDHFLEAERLGSKDHGLDFYLGNLKSDLENKSS